MKYTNKYNLPEVIFKALTKEYYTPGETQFSVTKLINPPKVTLLTARHFNEIEEDISENLWKVFGSAIHNIFEESTKESHQSEIRLYGEKDGLKFSGKFDVLDGTILTDYKVTSVYSLIFGNNKYAEQLNLLYWLCKQNNIPITKLQIIMILRDWRRKESERDADYPKLPIHVLDIPMMSDVDLEKYVNDRVKLYNSNLGLSDNDIPICTPEERWRKEDTFAIYKNANKTALRVLNNKEEALTLVENMSKQYPKDSFNMRTRPGEDRKCLSYCSAAQFCNYYQSLKKEE